MRIGNFSFGRDAAGRVREGTGQDRGKETLLRRIDSPRTSDRTTGLPVNTPSPEPTRDPDDGQWFEREVHAHEAQLKSYLGSSYPLGRDVEDVVQEAYLRVWKVRLSRPIHSAKSFLFQVARHLAIDLLRRNRVSPLDSLPDFSTLSVLDDGHGVTEIACSREEIALLGRAFDALPGRCREVMIMRQVHGIPQREIARQLGLSELTVQTHVVNGLRRIEAFMHRYARERSSR